jgi:hypothetical protein
LILAALGTGLVLALLVLMVSELQTSREHIQSQDAKATLQLKVLSQLSDQSEPILDSGRRALAPIVENRPELKRTFSELPSLSTALLRALDSTMPVIDELRDSGTLRSLEMIGPTLDEARPVLEQAASPEAQELAARSLRTLDSLRLQSLRRALDRGARLSNQAVETNLVKRLRRTTRQIGSVLEVQRATRVLQRKALGIQRRSLVVQEETLDHAKSLDRKLGGETVP